MTRAAVNEPPLNIAIIGAGKIALDQHVPALRADPTFRLVACATHAGGIDGVPAYSDLDSMLAADLRLDAVAICTPPKGRAALAAAAVDAGLHVLLEKPPAATIEEARLLARLVERSDRTIFTAWHSREAAGVDAARHWLANRTIVRGRIDWQEDIRRWHPGQEWILAPDGFGVFDPGINALSIASVILPRPLVVESAELDVPANRSSPIAVRAAMRCWSAPFAIDFDFLQTGPQTWTIEVETTDGSLVLADGGRTITIAGEPGAVGVDREYPRLYRRFADLVRTGKSDLDLHPLEMVADMMAVGRVTTVAPFAF